MELALRNGGDLAARQGVTMDMQSRFISYLDAKPRTVESYAKSLKPFFAYLASNGIAWPRP